MEVSVFYKKTPSIKLHQNKILNYNILQYISFSFDNYSYNVAIPWTFVDLWCGICRVINLFELPQETENNCLIDYIYKVHLLL